MYEKKPVVYKSPDLSKLREVVIDHRTRIYIGLDKDIEEAKIRYRARILTKKS